MPKIIQEKEVIDWLSNNAFHIKLLKWAGRSTIKSQFIDVNRNKVYQDLNYKVLCFSGQEIMNDWEEVELKILKNLGELIG